MNKLQKRYKAWRLRRQQLTLARWAQERAKGKNRIAFRYAFTFTVLMVAVHDVYNHFFDVGDNAFSLFYIIKYAIIGIFVGYGSWGRREDDYKRALKSSAPAPFYPKTYNGFQSHPRQ